jgi:hypothetical protein
LKAKSLINKIPLNKIVNLIDLFFVYTEPISPTLSSKFQLASYCAG